MSTLRSRIDRLETECRADSHRLDISVRMFRQALRRKATSPMALAAAFGLGLVAGRLQTDAGRHMDLRAGVARLARLWALGGMSMLGR